MRVFSSSLPAQNRGDLTEISVDVVKEQDDGRQATNERRAVWVGGGRTYRGEVDTAEISGGLQASQSKLGMHTILNTQSPFCTYSPGALTPPTRLR